jgi:hypothetical protein
MVYATFADVALKYEQPLDDAAQPRVERVLADLSDILDELIPSLADRVTASARLARTARRVVVDAVIRQLDNPRGYLGESAGEVSYYYGVTTARERTGPGKPFTDAELRPLRPTGRSTVGTIRVRTPGDLTWTTTTTADAVP